MYISTNDWLNYINKLSKLNKSAADAIVAYVQKNGFSDTDALISYANAVVQTYGSGSAALAAAMYDATAEAAGYFYDPAEPAALPGYGEIAKTVKGTLKTSQNVNELAGAVSRLVKRAGADTTLQNAYRDRPRKKYGKKRNTGAQIAWVPHGDTCPFCLMLASNGWRNQTVGGAQNHAEHIHSNCDCTYAVRFDDHSGVQGYDPDVYKDMYDNAEGDTWKEKVNSMRRAQYAKDKDRINAQKRAAYAERTSNNKTLVKNLKIDDFQKLINDQSVVEKNEQVSKDVIEAIYNSLKSQDALLKFKDISFVDKEDGTVFDTELKQHGLFYECNFAINRKFFAGLSTEEASEVIKNSVHTVCNNIDEAVAHEVAHAKQAEKVNIHVVNRYNSEDGVSGISPCASEDMLESLSEASVLRDRGEYGKIPLESRQLLDAAAKELGLW